jgi:hypothetical protein
MLCDLAYTIGLPLADIFTPNTSRSAMLLSWTVFQDIGGTRRSGLLVAC